MAAPPDTPAGPASPPQRARAVPIAALVLLLGLAVVLARGGWSAREADHGAPGAGDLEERALRYGVVFEEVSRASRIDFVHEAPTFDAKLAHIMDQIASVGAAVSVVDFDRDGHLDLYVTNSREGSANRLYRNRGDGTFEDVAAGMGVAAVNAPGTGVSMGSAWGDLDNDGFEDLVLYKWGRQELYRNVGGARFERAGEAAGLPAWAYVNAVALLDFDRDGLLDLFLCGYWPESIDLWRLTTTQMMPESFEYAENGGRKWLLRNRGDGTFEDVTEAQGIASRRWTFAVGAADLDQDGWPDLFLANDYGVSELYRNRGEGRGFEDISRVSGVGERPKSGMNAAFGDVLNQGALAIYETNISEEGILLQGNNLWVPTGRAPSGAPRFENLAAGMGVELGGWSWGAVFGDLDLDGRLDLFLATGYVSAARDRSYWYSFSEVAGGHRSIIADAARWPAMEGRSLAGYQPSRVWLQRSAGRFTERARAVGVTDTFDGRAVALADLANRGALDVVVANQKGPLLIYRSRPDPRHRWIAFDLEGTRSNRSAIGARVTLAWAGGRQVQEVSGGAGFSAQSQRRLHFGLGPHDVVEHVEIVWPSGAVQRVDAPAVGRLHRVVEAP